MAGIGEAIAMALSGAAGEYAGNRATEIRAEDKARIAQAREEKMMALQQQYNTSEREATQKFGTSEREAGQNFKSTEDEKDRAFRTSERVASQGFQAGENAKSRAASLEAQAAKAKADGIGPNGKALKGTPQKMKDQDDNEFMVYNYTDGTNERVYPDDIPIRGGKGTPKDKQDAKAAEDKYVQDRIDEMAGTFSSDKDDFKEYGGSRSKAEQALRKEFKSQQSGAASVPDAEPAAPVASETKAEAAPAKTGYTPKQQLLIDRVKAAHPDASDADIVAALRQNPKTASQFQ